MNLTPQQNEAKLAQDKRILVSAAAGSGKTRVLVERVGRLLEEGVPLQRMLIITYTNAAAGELKDRIRAHLTDNRDRMPDVYDQALLALQDAQISTIHGFGRKLIMEFFEQLKLNPNAQNAAEFQQEQLLQEAWKETMNELLARGNSDFMTLCSAYENDKLRELTISLYRFMMSLNEPMKWLSQAARRTEVRPFSETVWYQPMVRNMTLQLGSLVEQARQLRLFADDPDAIEKVRAIAEADYVLVQNLLPAAEQGAEALIRAAAEVKWPRIPNIKADTLTSGEAEWKEAYTRKRKSLKAALDELKEQYDLGEESLDRELDNLGAMVRGLDQFMPAFYERYQELKRSQDLIDFNDMEQLTGLVLDDPDIRQMVRERFDHIFVDEFQDVSKVQYGILTRVAGPDACVFMVGDPKQSIYRFRNADPTIFMNMVREKTFGDGEDQLPVRVIWLQQNFRSRTAILMAANDVFSRAMRKNVTEMDYSEHDHLKSGRDDQVTLPAELHIMDAQEGEEALATETAAVIRRIRELKTTPRDPEDPSSLPYDYRDMVIQLAEAAKTGPQLASYLTAAGIPVLFDGKVNYYQLKEIEQIKTLLQLIDNEYQDDALAAALKLKPFELTDLQLANIRLQDNRPDVPLNELFRRMETSDSALGAKCRRVREQLEQWRVVMDLMPLQDFLWHVYRTSGYYAWCGTQPGGELKQANLRMLAQKAAEWEKYGRTGLRGFIRQMKDESSTGSNEGARVLSEQDDLVRIMTMHKSKGLEFPVVFLMRTTAPLLKRNSAEGARFQADLGIDLPYYDPEMNVWVTNTLLHAIFVGKKRLEELSERCRLLYVAMTRPKSRLIVTGCVPGGDREAWHMPEGDVRVSSAGCMLDWIMQAVMDEDPRPVTPEGQDRGLWYTVLESVDEKPVTTLKEAEVDGRAIADEMADEPLASRFLWWDDKEPQPALPPKISVTTWVKTQRRQLLADHGEEETAQTKRIPQEPDKPPRLEDLPRRPKFMEEQRTTAAERGTCIHRLLMLMDLPALRGLTGSALEGELDRQVKRLWADEVISYQEYVLADPRMLAAYYGSGLGQRVLASPEVHREWHFDLLVDGSILQGVVDCAFKENGKWVIVDYKTDHFTDGNAFMAHHRPQLEWYARAVATLTGVEVSGMYLYAISYGRVYEL